MIFDDGFDSSKAGDIPFSLDGSLLTFSASFFFLNDFDGDFTYIITDAQFNSVYLSHAGTSDETFTVDPSVTPSFERGLFERSDFPVTPSSGAAVPEPSSIITLAGLLATFGAFGWWKKRRQGA